MSDKNLRSGLIRLAHTKPDLRAALLPLLASGQSKKASDAMGRMRALRVQHQKEMAELEQLLLEEIATAAAEIVRDNGGLVGPRKGGTIKGSYKGESFEVKWAWDFRMGTQIAVDAKWGHWNKQFKLLVGSSDQVASESMFKHFNGFID
jgi:hypothetical protein